MTIDEERLPQSYPAEGLEVLVQALADRAEATDRRSAELAERVALLEGQRGSQGKESPASIGEECPPARDRHGPARVYFSQSTINASSRSIIRNDEDGEGGLIEVAGVPEEGLPNEVTGVPEDDPERALADRVMILERRLEDYEEDKGVLNEREIELPESTFTFLITHRPQSVPFVFALFSMALSIGCLSLTLASSVKRTADNRLGFPSGVDPSVRAAQFLGAIVGVLMEDEIPQGLQLIANGAGHTLLLNGQKAIQKRVVISSVFRLVVGYLFLSSLLINLAQNDDVISILYDVLALEFVENIDDTTFALAKKGFFGRAMLVAANESHSLKISGMSHAPEMRRSVTGASAESMGARSMVERSLSLSGMITSNNRVNSVVRCIYFLNAAVVLSAMGYITTAIKDGQFRCNVIRVAFGEEVWENATVVLPDGGYEQRLLIYPAFNGIYREQGSAEDYPKYVEQNKNDGSEFGSSVTAAVIKYCHEISSWVFMHPDILVDNECDWLWRSPKTQDYDILSTTFDAWEAWTGEVSPAQASITCNECSELSDCNYHGTCDDEVCRCDTEHFGDSCEFDWPCDSLATEKAYILDPVKGARWEQKNPINLWGNDQTKLHRVYNRPVYIQKGISGEPYDMRLYKLREREKSSSPSTQPSDIPSVSTAPTPFPSRSPTLSPTNAPICPNCSPHHPTPQPTWGAGVGTNWVANDVPFIWGDDAEDDPAAGPGSVDVYTGVPPTEPPTRPLHSQNEYDTAPDFADWDDFFESPHLHDLEEILEGYSVVIAYSGSRFYGTIVESDATLDELFPPDYHAFWSRSLNMNRTFIISDTTFGGSPVGIDFFEMRRRVDSMLHNKNVHFSYGPYGALIPLMEYQDTGFFHCLDKTSQSNSLPSYYRVTYSPTSSPASSWVQTSSPWTTGGPTSSPSTSLTSSPLNPPTSSPSTNPTSRPSSSSLHRCFPVVFSIDRNCDLCSFTVTTWEISKSPDSNGVSAGNSVIPVIMSVSYDGCCQSDKICLSEGLYILTIDDLPWDGQSSPHNYTLELEDGGVLLVGGEFEGNATIEFSVSPPKETKGAMACEFCPNGMPDSEFVLPDDTTCGRAQVYASSLDAYSGSCSMAKFSEPICCPPDLGSEMTIFSPP